MPFMVPVCRLRWPRADFAPLGALRTREEADFTIGLIDAFACAADVLTFYQERIANESYLRTAVERISLQELGKLIGYHAPRRGCSGRNVARFCARNASRPAVDAGA